MPEYIERRTAISALLDCPVIGRTGTIFASDALKRLANVPKAKNTAQVHGCWMHASSLIDPFCEVWKCSVCGREDENGAYYDFCPNCGTKMDLEE